MKTIVNGFQFRIQEALDIKDQKIDRLSELLVNYKAKILECKQEIVILDSKIEEKKKEIVHRVTDKRVTKGVSRSQKVSSHHKQIIQIQLEQSQEIQELQNSFSQKLARFHEFSQEQMQEQDDSFNEEIEKVKREIAETQTKISSFQVPPEKFDTSSLQIKNDVIQHLQKVVEQKSEERKAMLLDFKMQLSDYLAFLSKLDAQHQKSVTEIQNAVDENTKLYHETIRNLKSKRNHEIKILNEQKKEAEKTLHNYSMQLSKMKESFSQSCIFTTKKFDAMKSLSYFKSHDENVPQNSELSKLKEKWMKSLQVRKEKEFKLRSVREENYELKRQITVLKHARRYPTS